MLQTFLLLLPGALAIALSPGLVVEMILVLLSKRSKSNGLIFLLFLVLPVVVIPFVAALGLAEATRNEHGMSDLKAWLLLLFGALLLYLAVRNFVNRRDTSVPKIFSAIDNMGPAGVIGLAVAATILNPKILVILLGAGSIAAAAGLSNVTLIATIALFTLVATLPFSLPVAYVVFGGEAAAHRMERLKEWLLTNNRLMTAIVLGLLGAAMAAKAVSVLLT